MQLKRFNQFINEAAANAAEAEQLQSLVNAEAAAEANLASAAAPTPIPPQNNIKISVVKNGGNSAIRVVGEKGTKDYKINVKSFVYSGPIVPTNFWRSEKNNAYYIATNADQTQKLSQEDVNKFVKAYQSDSNRTTIPGTIADLTLVRTWDFS